MMLMNDPMIGLRLGERPLESRLGWGRGGVGGECIACTNIFAIPSGLQEFFF